MNETGFLATASALGALYALGLLGFMARRLSIVSEQGTTDLSRLLVDLILPPALFHAMFTQFEPGDAGFLKLVAGFQAVTILVGLSATAVLAIAFRARARLETLLCLGTMQNNVYLPLPVSVAVLSAVDAPRAQYFIGCYVLFFSPVLWGMGALLLSRHTATVRPTVWEFLTRAFNRPFIATLLGLGAKLLFVKMGWTMPTMVTQFTGMCLGATAPLATIVLGAALADAHWSRDFDPRGIAAAALSKLVIIPAVVVGMLVAFGPFDPVFAFSALLQAAAPPATNLTLIAKRFGGNPSLVAVALFISYGIALFTIPLWLTAL